ncbi:hypothetical protein ACH5RR_003978 [Cinchona calisaya]|uniref:Uncharacterized protein n=1 Tax=Cinchona calisaya TaxID=153742 RepID=A0ABD3AWD7_9GENT
MASLDTDVTMVPAGEGSSGAGPSSSTASTSSSSKKSKRFEIKKWNAVALWAWDIVVDNCAICRNHIMDLCEFFMFSASTNCASSVKLIKLVLLARSARLLGVFATMLFISTVLADGSKHAKFVHWITVSGSSRSMAIRPFGQLTSWASPSAGISLEKKI